MIKSHQARMGRFSTQKTRLLVMFRSYSCLWIWNEGVNCSHGEQLNRQLILSITNLFIHLVVQFSRKISRAKVWWWIFLKGSLLQRLKDQQKQHHPARFKPTTEWLPNECPTTMFQLLPTTFYIKHQFKVRSFLPGCTEAIKLSFRWKI